MKHEFKVGDPIIIKGFYRCGEWIEDQEGFVKDIHKNLSGDLVYVISCSCTKASNFYGEETYASLDEVRRTK